MLISIAKAVKGDPNDLLEIYGYARQSPLLDDIVFEGVGSFSFQKDLEDEDREKYEIAVKSALASAKAMIENEREKENTKQINQR